MRITGGGAIRFGEFRKFINEHKGQAFVQSLIDKYGVQGHIVQAFSVEGDMDYYVAVNTPENPDPKAEEVIRELGGLYEESKERYPTDSQRRTAYYVKRALEIGKRYAHLAIPSG